MFNELPEGQTHSFGDGCGEEAHNPPEWEENIGRIIRENLWGYVCDRCRGDGTTEGSMKCRECRGCGITNWQIEPLIAKFRQIVFQTREQAITDYMKALPPEKIIHEYMKSQLKDQPWNDYRNEAIKVGKELLEKLANKEGK